MFSDHNGIRNQYHKDLSAKSPNMWKLNNSVLNNPWVKEEIKRDIRKYFEINENENTSCQNV